MIQNQVFELTFQATPPCGDWAQPDLVAVFTCNGTSTSVKSVKGFYDGDNTCKIRFLPEICGEYHWKSLVWSRLAVQKSAPPLRKAMEKFIPKVFTSSI